jgi:Flp pilus assembly secretin CpaC
MVVLGTGAGLLAHRALAAKVRGDKAQPAGAQGSLQDSSPPEAKNGERQLVFRCKVVEVGDDGQKRRLSEPTLVTMAGQTASVLTGGEATVEGFNPEGQKVAEFEPLGLQLELRGDRAQARKIRLHALLAVSQLDKETRRDDARIPGRFVRVVEMVRLGEAVHLALKDDEERVRVQARIQVEHAPSP